MSTTTLNITFGGVSADHPLHADVALTDADVRRIAIELIRSGDIAGLHVAALPAAAFDDYVVDRMSCTDGGQRLYLRPKVPFGA
jgi:hypothetical protein